MQTIKHEDGYTHIHPIFKSIETFYGYTSQKMVKVPNTLIRPKYDDAFRYLHHLFSEYSGYTYPVKFDDKAYKPLKLPRYNKKNIILLFSGGRDSVAEILILQKAGFNVHLYHMKRINQSFPNEHEHVKQIAEYLGLPYYIDDNIGFSGHHDWMEHPMKNMIIANGAIKWGIEQGIGVKLATGNFLNETLHHGVFNLCASDTVEMWDAYAQLVREAIPSFETVRADLTTVLDTLEILAERKDLLEMACSCLFPYRWRGQLIRQNEKRFGIKFMPNRCCSCAKCAIEYVFYAERGLLEFNEDLFGHCLQVMYNQRMKETDFSGYNTFDEFWAENLWYSSDTSKMKEKLKTAELNNHKIKICGKRVR